MAEKVTLADVLQGREPTTSQGGIDAQAMDRLVQSVPSGDRNWRNVYGDLMDWAEINIAHPINRAGMMPARSLAYKVDPTGREPFWHPQGPGDHWWKMYGPSINSVGAIGDSLGYSPGERESANVEIRKR